jgi:predicted RNA-binding protein YlqC (UPF0109 family)
MASSIDQQFIEYIVKSLVNNPEAVTIERRIDEKGVLLELTVDQEDLGRVIGKRGATAQSLRTLLRALGTKNDARYNLKIVDVGPPPESRQRAEEISEPREETPAADSTPVSDDTAAADDTSADDAQSADSTNDISMDDDEDLPETPIESDHSDVVSRTRKELEELDDLDV